MAATKESIAKAVAPLSEGTAVAVSLQDLQQINKIRGEWGRVFLVLKNNASIELPLFHGRADYIIYNEGQTMHIRPWNWADGAFAINHHTGYDAPDWRMALDPITYTVLSRGYHSAIAPSTLPNESKMVWQGPTPAAIEEYNKTFYDDVTLFLHSTC